MKASIRSILLLGSSCLAACHSSKPDSGQLLDHRLSVQRRFNAVLGTPHCRVIMETYPDILAGFHWNPTEQDLDKIDQLLDTCGAPKA